MTDDIRFCIIYNLVYFHQHTCAFKLFFIYYPHIPRILTIYYNSYFLLTKEMLLCSYTASR